MSQISCFQSACFCERTSLVQQHDKRKSNQVIVMKDYFIINENRTFLFTTYTLCMMLTF